MIRIRSAFNGVVKRLSFIALAVICAIAAVQPALAGPSIAVEVSTGRVIEHHDAFQRWYPASLTKLMTIYVTFRAIRSGKISLEDPVIMTRRAAAEPASKMYFKPGARFPLDSALKYLMVKSANDIAVAIAETVGGDLQSFIDTMNAEARKIGMTSTHFVNPNGLPQPGQYTTARDMALLAVTLRREFPEFATYFNLEGFSVGGRTYENYNMLIGRFDGADGMKTGYICASGYNQVSSATRDGRTVVSVVFGAIGQVARAEESARLLEEAFSSEASSETLLTLEPYGEDRNQVRDVSDQICSESGRKARAETRDENGQLVFNSPLIEDMDHEPHFVPAPMGEPIGNGPASAAEAAILLGTRHIPLPNYRPAM